MAEQIYSQAIQCTNPEVNLQKNSISYSRLAAEVDQEDKEKEIEEESPKEYPNRLLILDRQPKNPFISLKPQEREQSYPTQDGLHIFINYLSQTERIYQKESKVDKKGNKNQNMYATLPTSNHLDTKPMITTQLRPITQQETQHKKSDEEQNEQKTLIQSQIPNNLKKKGSLQIMMNPKNPLPISKLPIQIGKGSTQSQANEYLNRQLDDSVELVGNVMNLETEKNKMEQQNPFKFSKTNKTIKQSDKKISSYTTATILFGGKDEYARMIQTLQKVEADLMKISLKKRSAPLESNANKQKLSNQNPPIRSIQQIEKGKNKKTQNKINLLISTKSLDKFDRKLESNILRQKQSDLFNKTFDRMIKQEVWGALLFQISNKRGQIENSLKQISMLLKLPNKCRIYCEEPFTVQYNDEKMLQVSYSKKIYIGQYLNSIGCLIKHGNGIQIDPLRSMYRGSFKNGAKQGLGKIYYIEKYSYEGEWKSGTMEGQGVLETKGNGTYEGGFVNGKKHGYGIEQWLSGDRYEGYFQNNAFHGEGRYFWKNGARYQGAFMNDLIHGYGKWVSKNGERYEGNFINGQKEGLGVYSWKNGKKFEGQFKNGSRKTVISPRQSTNKGVCDVSFQKASQSPKRFRIIFEK